MILTTVLVGIFGLAMGSFLLVIAHRLDALPSVITGRSQCDHCHETLHWYELIPLVSYGIQRGRCRNCNHKFSGLYPFFELLTALVAVALWVLYGATMPWWFVMLQWVIASGLMLLLMSDWLYQSFPTWLLLGVLGVLMVHVVVSGYLLSDAYTRVTLFDPLFAWLSAPTVAWQSALLGGLVGGGLPGLLAFPSREKWMGYGDVMVSALLGLWVGYPFILLLLILAVYIGALVGVGLLMSQKAQKNHQIAFGPFLIVSAFVIQVWGRELFYVIMQWWRVV